MLDQYDQYHSTKSPGGPRVQIGAAAFYSDLRVGEVCPMSTYIDYSSVCPIP